MDSGTQSGSKKTVRTGDWFGIEFFLSGLVLTPLVWSAYSGSGVLEGGAIHGRFRPTDGGLWSIG
ncbi:MAG: hypothetical protein AB1646_17100 [Thermodesulfobacteriota bacterium]